MRRTLQYFLISPRLSIFGSRNCIWCSPMSMLFDCLKSRLCSRQAFLRFFDVESMPEMRSCEFYAFSREGRAVSTLRVSSWRPLTKLQRRFPSKLGVRMVRLEMSAPIGRSRRGEGAYRQAARLLKKSAGSLELLMRMFLRRAKLWLMLGVSVNESSVQNYMLEIQLFGSPCPLYLLRPEYPLAPHAPQHTPPFHLLLIQEPSLNGINFQNLSNPYRNSPIQWSTAHQQCLSTLQTHKTKVSLPFWLKLCHQLQSKLLNQIQKQIAFGTIYQIQSLLLSCLVIIIDALRTRTHGERRKNQWRRPSR